MALRTCEGWIEPLVQADPAEQQMPRSSRRRSAPSLAIPPKEMLVVVGLCFSLYRFKDRKNTGLELIAKLADDRVVEMGGRELGRLAEACD